MAVTELVTIEEIREFLEADDAIDDEVLEALATEASDAIPRYCNREFGDHKGVTRTFDFLPRDFSTGHSESVVVNFSPFEYRTITSMTIDPAYSGGTVLKPEQFRPWPNATREGTYYGVRLSRNLPAMGANAQEFPLRQIAVTGDFGTGEVPPLIQRYAKQTVESWLHLRRDPGMGMNVLEHDGEAPVRPDDLPPAVRFGLRSAFQRPLYPR